MEKLGKLLLQSFKFIKFQYQSCFKMAEARITSDYFINMFELGEDEAGSRSMMSITNLPSR